MNEAGSGTDGRDGDGGLIVKFVDLVHHVGLRSALTDASEGLSVFEVDHFDGGFWGRRVTGVFVASRNGVGDGDRGENKASEAEENTRHVFFFFGGEVCLEEKKK